VDGGLVMSRTPGRPRGLLLDAMGTLITLRESVGSSYAALARDHGVVAEAAAIDAVFPTVYRQAPPLAFAGLSGEALLEAEIGWWGERISETFAALTLPRPDAALQRALFDHFAQPERWLVYGEVAAQLTAWRQAGLRLAVVSNFDSRLHGLLQSLGLLTQLDAVVISSEVGAAKPDPRPLQLALAALELTPEQAWHIGDSADDVAAARGAGVHCLRIERHRTEQSPHHRSTMSG
jgi:putative hydrolase of the HAD superfamily